MFNIQQFPLQYSALFASRQSRVDLNRLKLADVPGFRLPFNYNRRLGGNSHIPANALRFPLCPIMALALKIAPHRWNLQLKICAYPIIHLFL